MAIKVLRNVGWPLGCVCTDTLNPNKGGETRILWGKIGPGVIKVNPNIPTKNRVDIHIWDWQHEDIAIAQLLICWQDQVQHSNNYVLGSLHEGKSRTHEALALTTGLERVYHHLARPYEEDGELFVDPGDIAIYTDYEPLQDQRQLGRWKLYGTPDPPAPNQQDLNAILSKWTRFNNVKKLSINDTMATNLHRDQMESWRRKELTDLCKMERVKKWNLPTTPMTQIGVKELFKDKQDKDEAQAIKFLAEEPSVRSVAGRIYSEWNLDRKLIKMSHESMANSRSLQVTVNNIVGATRFKAFEGSQPMKAIRQKKGRGKTDSWEHFRECYQVPDLSTYDRKGKVEAIIEVCKRAEQPNPARPCPSNEPYETQNWTMAENERTSNIL